MICERTLTFRPSSTYLHLPPDETLTSTFPGDVNWMLMHHITIGSLVSAILVFWLGPFLPGTYVLSTVIMFLAFLFNFFRLFIGDAIGEVVLSNKLKDCIPEPKVQVTYGFVLELILNFLSCMSFIILGTIAWKIDTSGPPGEDVELQPPRDSSKSED
nr:hypothetical protein I302_00917 [Kwoniella bestiolae CBS 10118]OCF29412.1 hypothetical protein I302_00917 [Kwoniella bestiolae CBS 10118]